MLRTTLRSLWSHKRRLVSTCIAVILGVAFMAGTLVLTSTLNKVFDDLFAGLGDGVSAVVRGPELFESDFGGTQRDVLDESVLAKVQAVPGVAAANGSMSTFELTVLDEDGEPMGGAGPPTFVGSWDPDPVLNPYSLVEGHAPEARNEVVIDKATANDGPFAVGDEITLLSADGREKFQVVGIARFGSADSAGGAVYVGTTLAEAQKLANQPGKLQEIYARADKGVSDTELVTRIENADVTPKVDVVTGKQAADEQASDVKAGFGFFSTILSVFAFIALFVGWFVISNTFSILVAQRTKELALLRALGASRRQVLASVLVEAWAVGLVSAVIGFGAGVLLAGGALAALRAIGIDLPSANLVIPPTVAAFAIILGLVITTVAAIMPAIRATRVPPIAALRDVAIDHGERSRVRLGLGLLAVVIGALMVVPAFGTDPTTDDLPGIGIGMALLVVAVLLLAPVVAKPLSEAVGYLVKGLIKVRDRLARLLRPLSRPFRKGPVDGAEESHEVIGTLARQNAMRNPRRTASTASALIIGVTLVGFITVFASSAQTSITSTIDKGFEGDYIVQPVNQFSFAGVTPKLAEDLAAVDGVEVVTALSAVPGQLTLADGKTDTAFLSGIDPATFDQIFSVRMTEGQLSDLADGQIVVDRQVAERKQVKIGDKVELVAAGGNRDELTVSAISNDPSLLGEWAITRADAMELNALPTDFMIGIKLDADKTVEEMRAPLKRAVAPYPTMKLQDREQFTGSLIKQISAILNFIYALLAVSIIIALIGIANTLSLSIHERTRELGLLRATGMTRSQLRASVRWEAVIVALMGTGIGLILGLGLSYILVKGLAGQGFSSFDVPLSGMALVVVFGAGLGIVAAIRPARKAAKLNVLEAIATE